ncbi:GFA family protein [Sphingomonas panacisoli]|uniref:GFA family protein n=2 Tax=Sphingomonas panacisoli TaxID=1813879 RepID=A0A5B8LFH6_9SPHN|nr:GFA family protein [Sphingomonas panacisoli]
MLEGGCACGAVRYRLDYQPYDTGWCHCRLCQRLSGSGGMIFTTVPLFAFVIVDDEGKAGRFASTPTGERSFCTACGTPLTIHVRHQADEIDIAVGSLDDPNAVTPGFHLFARQAPSWTTFTDGLPRYDALRPNTRGLASGQTEL